MDGGGDISEYGSRVARGAEGRIAEELQNRRLENLLQDGEE